MGKFNGFNTGASNMQGLMRQAQRMQQEVARVQEEVGNTDFEASVGGGAVKVVVNGNKEFKSIEISPAAVDPDDVEMLEDLIMAAVNEALRKVEESSADEMSKLTGGLILVLGILQPLVTMDYEDLYDMVSSLPAGAISQETLEEKTYEPMKGIIEEELSAYIVDKGEQLGASCSAQVVCAPGEGELPVPIRATVTGQLTQGQKQDLSHYMEEELDIPREAQIYRNEELP